MNDMNWERLLSLNKFDTKGQRRRSAEDEQRVSFEVDYDRVIFSSEFRSLQDKTQVIPLSKKDFVHTRLTHSMEVSVVARSLGRIVGKVILDRHPDLGNSGYKINDFGSIVAAAALAHDIGNPPFGHEGERAIGGYFLYDKGKQLKDRLEPKQYQDLCDFEGNANGFKILTRSSSGGLRLTNAMLGTFVKYPKESLPQKPTKHVCDKKYGFFQSEKSVFLDLATDLGLLARKGESISFVRHPLAYLVEAADDICYSIIDFEDGVNLGWISEREAEEMLMPFAERSLDFEKYKALETRTARVGYLRAITINTLIRDVGSVFLDNELTLLRGQLDVSLMDKSYFYRYVKDILELSCERIYESEEVIEKEVAGYRMLKTLLDVFVKAYIHKIDQRTTPYDNQVLKLLPKHTITTGDLYLGVMEICTFVAGLTDGKVVMLHKKISGSSF